MPTRRTQAIGRPRSAALALLLLSACTATPEATPEPAPEATPEPTPTPSSDPAPTSPASGSTSDAYAEFDMPAASEAWSLADYTRARTALAAIAKQDPALLPRAGSATFTNLADVPQLGKLAAGSSRESLVGLSLALGLVQQVYADQRERDPDFEREHLIVLAAVLAVTTKLPQTVARDASEAEALRAEPARLRGLLRFRHGIHQLSAELLGFEPKSELAYGFACEQLAAVIDEVGPLLLPEERSAARAKLDACTKGGADPAALARLRTALADEAPSAALVSALLPEHREFARSARP